MFIHPSFKLILIPLAFSTALSGCASKTVVIDGHTLPEDREPALHYLADNQYTVYKATNTEIHTRRRSYQGTAAPIHVIELEDGKLTGEHEVLSQSTSTP